MKVLVWFKPNKKFDNFEGARMRKSIKGALELLDVNHTDNSADFFDIAHLMSPIQEREMSECHSNGAPVVVSALYTEDDPCASFIEMSKKDRINHLSSKSLRFLNKADLVLVPCEAAKEFLEINGVTSPIEPCYAGVNMSRFDFSKEDEKEIFYRYYREDKNKKIVIAVGDYDNKMDSINSFINAAKKCPKAVFYYIGKLTTKNKLSLSFRKFTEKAPKNVKFVDVPPDDIYRSALLNASVFMVPGYKIAGVTSIVEAMAAKTQIIARKSAIFDGVLEDGVTAHLAEFSETLSSLTRDFLDGKIKPTTTQAYDVICQHDLRVFGDELLKKYQTIMKNNINRRLEK